MFRTNVIIILLLVSATTVAQQIYLDTFSSVSYSNNDGNSNWASDWVESGDTDLGPSAQYIYITGGQLTFAYIYDEFIYRLVDLSGATAATLSFDFQTNSLGGNQELGVYISNDGGATYNFLGGVSGVGSFSQDISAYIASNTLLAFTKTVDNWAADDWAQIDNVQIVASSTPYLVVEDVAVSEDVGNLIFTVTQQGVNAGAPYSVNFTTSDGTAIANSDYLATTGTINFSGALGEAQTITVPIVNDAITEADEFFNLSFTSSSNPSLDYSDTATGTINSQVPFNQPLVLQHQFAGYVNYTSTAGTFRTQDNVTDACALTITSSNTLFSSVPATASIQKALLYWSHSNYTLDDTVTFEGQQVTAERIYESGLNFNGDILTFYGYVSDVTSILEGIGVANLGTTTFDVTDLEINSGFPFCDYQTVLGGWSLMVFYEDASLPASNINLYEGFDGLSNASTSFTLDSFFAIAGTGAKASFLSWEGDATLDGNSEGTTNPNGERLSITNQAGFNFTLSGDGGQTGNNAYNSTAFDNTQVPNVNNGSLYGVDWDTFDIASYIAPTDTQVTANVDVGQDFVVSNAVVIKVPSNLVTGFVFEDINYPGGAGRNRATASGQGVANVTVELYNSLGFLQTTTTTDANGQYIFGGMADGTYTVRVVNESVSSTRGGGVGCSDCYAVQTFRSDHNGTDVVDVTDEVGGANPSQEDVSAGNLFGAQSVSTLTLASNGIVGIDFGFNFNTIVNTNENGQGSLDQFIVNSNNLDETGLDIEANALFDPVAGEDTSIFMIPSDGDPLGRTADTNYTNGYFDIFFNDAFIPSDVVSDNTVIDGRTQTAYSGDTNTGTIGGGSTVGTNSVVLPNYNLPEIQVHRNAGDIFKLNANNLVVRNIAVFGNTNAAIQVNTGTANIVENLLGVNALGVSSGNIQYGVENVGGEVTINSNHIASNTVAGVVISGGTSSVLTQNHFAENGATSCDDAILVTSGSGINIQHNLIENSASLGIDAVSGVNNLSILGNTIVGSGRVAGLCASEIKNMGIEISGSNSIISNNVITSNGGAGLVISGSGSSNLISENSFFANGTATGALGIDLGNDGVTINDLGDTDSGANGLNNFPILSAAYQAGNNLVLMGWITPGATVEFFFTDISEGSAAEGANTLSRSKDYGEGQTYIATRTEGSLDDLEGASSSYSVFDGNTDNVNRFKFSVPLPIGTDLGDKITATATLSNTTSEFSPEVEVRLPTVITNRTITYRVNRN
ncbi:MAG: sodium:calcium exchanger [Pseudozobellia sp.]|nr:sodium:calcium exchanger [Pseudozobellia sp.]|tara:strand:+ start:20260 stop:24003 length:3744 start_codon:yes stop_codon:yes gene_type:complete